MNASPIRLMSSQFLVSRTRKPPSCEPSRAVHRSRSCCSNGFAVQGSVHWMWGTAPEANHGTSVAAEVSRPPPGRPGVHPLRRHPRPRPVEAGQGLRPRAMPPSLSGGASRPEDGCRESPCSARYRASAARQPSASQALADLGSQVVKPLEVLVPPFAPELLRPAIPPRQERPRLRRPPRHRCVQPRWIP